MEPGLLVQRLNKMELFSSIDRKVCSLSTKRHLGWALKRTDFSRSIPEWKDLVGVLPCKGVLRSKPGFELDSSSLMRGWAFIPNTFAPTALML